MAGIRYEQVVNNFVVASKSPPLVSHNSDGYYSTTGETPEKPAAK
jgi:hypothetical protein